MRHPNVVNLREVLASKTHVYMVLELVTGGELFDRIATSGRMEESVARVYFQQLVDGVSYCHERGVCHRDLKPENLLLDASGRLKISDFGLSCLPEQNGRSMAALRTTCGTPNYVAPEVLRGQGYDGRAADVWSLGCILYVLTAGGMPFDEPALPALFAAITAARFRCPPHFSAPLVDLITSILTADPKKRAKMGDIVAHPWFAPGYVRAAVSEEDDDGPGSTSGAGGEFTEVEVAPGGRTSLDEPPRPAAMTAFDLIGAASGLDLGRMFERGGGDGGGGSGGSGGSGGGGSFGGGGSGSGPASSAPTQRGPTRFPSAAPAGDIVAALIAGSASLGFASTHKGGFTLRLEADGSSRPRPLVAAAQVFELCPGLHMVELRKLRGDTREFVEFYDALKRACSDVVLRPQPPPAHPHPPPAAAQPIAAPQKPKAASAPASPKVSSPKAGGFGGGGNPFGRGAVR